MARQPADFFWVGASVTAGPSQLSPGGAIEPAAISGALTSDYAPSGIQTCGVLIISASLATQLGGIEAPAKGQTRSMYLLNAGSFAISLIDSDAGSAAANRFQVPGGTSSALRPGAGAHLIYAPTVARWILAAGPGGTTATATVVTATPYSATATDTIIMLDTGASVILLPPIADHVTKQITIKDRGLGATEAKPTVVPNGAETIDGVTGAAALTLDNDHAAVTLIGSGTEWSIV